MSGTDSFVYLLYECITKPRSLAHLHVSLACFGALNKLSALLCLIVTIQHTFKPFLMLWNPRRTQRACRDSTFRGPCDSSRWLYFEGLGIGQGRLTWQSYPLGPEWKWCLCQRWIIVVLQRILIASFWNHALLCCSEAGLHLFIVMILSLRSFILCEPIHAYIHCFYIMLKEIT